MKLLATATVLSVLFNAAAYAGEMSVEKVGPDKEATRELGRGGTEHSPRGKHSAFYRDVTLLRASPGYKKLVRDKMVRITELETPDDDAAPTRSTIYVMPGTSVHHVTKAAFKTVVVGDAELLQVTPGATNRDLLITANQPDETLDAVSNVVMTDDQGKLVEDLRVVVTPLEGPSSTVQILKTDKDGNGINETYRCTDSTCANASTGKSRSGISNADSMTQTKWSDGSTSTSRTWNKK